MYIFVLARRLILDAPIYMGLACRPTLDAQTYIWA